MFRNKIDVKLIANLNSMVAIQKNYIESIAELTTQLKHVDERIEHEKKNAVAKHANIIIALKQKLGQSEKALVKFRDEV